MSDDHRSSTHILAASLAALVLVNFGNAGVCFAAVQCGALLTKDTKLKTNLVGCPGTGIEIRTDALTLDCNGFSIAGTGIGNGILVRADGVTIKNCQINGFAHGIDLAGAGGLVVGSAMTGNTHGVVNQGSNILWQENAFDKNQGTGYLHISGSQSTLENNSANFNGANGMRIRGNDMIIRQNSANNNGGHGFFVLGAVNALFDANTASANTLHGFNIQTSRNNSFENNTVERNLLHGFFLHSISTDNIFTGNRTLKCQRGIAIAHLQDSNNTLTNNLAQDNQVGLSLKGTQVVSGNTFQSNSTFGILMTDSVGSHVEFNHIANNARSTLAGIRAGLFMAGDSSENMILGNRFIDNLTTAIVLRNGNSSNKFLDNVIVSSPVGIALQGPEEKDNLFANNFFHNELNVSLSSESTNSWNTTMGSGSNILGGSLMGGNYYARPDGQGFSQSCDDFDANGICDSANQIDGGNIDSFPLTATGPRPTPGPRKLALASLGAGGGNSSDSIRLESNMGQFSGNGNGFWPASRCFEDLDGVSVADEAQLGSDPCAYDTDSDQVGDGVDACPLEPGRASWLGCPVGDKNIVKLQILDEHNLSGQCNPGLTTCELPLAGAEVKVFDRNLLKGMVISLLPQDDGENTKIHLADGRVDITEPHDSETGKGSHSPNPKPRTGSRSKRLSKNPHPMLYDDIYESVAANESALASRFGCTTNQNGICLIGEDYVGDFLVIIKYEDDSTGKVVYTGLPKGPEDFVDVEGDPPLLRATLEFHIIKFIDHSNNVFCCGNPAVNPRSVDCRTVRRELNGVGRLRPTVPSAPKSSTSAR